VKRVVVGHAALWGDVIEHEYGYRAQYGSVHNIMNVVGGKLDLEMLRGHYVAKSSSMNPPSPLCVALCRQRFLIEAR
jgi:hypothetical protein